MKQHGYQFIDGSDASPLMLEKCKQTGAYRDLKCMYLVQEPLPTEFVDKYDCVFSVGLMTHGHAGPGVID